MKKKLLLLLALLISMGTAYAQRMAGGQVLDETGQPMPAVGVTVKGTQTGTVTDGDGNFQLEAPEEATTLVFQSIGYKTQEQPIGEGVTVRMELASKELEG